MSVKVTIEHPSGAFKRTLSIQRISDPKMDSDGRRELDAVGEYQVLLLKGNIDDCQDGAPVAQFPHRYGDDLLTLVSEAIDALGGRGGEEMRR